MTRHAAIRCPLVSRVIARQLQYLAEYPCDTLTPHLREVCAKLSAHWANDAAEMERARTRSSIESGGGSNLLH